MGLFSRRKKHDQEASGEPERAEEAATADPASGAESAADAADAVAEAAQGDQAPQVGISMSAFRGVGAPAGPEVTPPAAQPDPAAEATAAASGTSAATPGAAAATGATAAPASPPAADAAAADASAATGQRPPLPLAPQLPPSQLETVPGLRDNAVLRESLAALPEKPTGAELLGVVRQMLQGHLFLRVQGDARAQLAEGNQVSFGIARNGDDQYMLAFTCGRALQEAVKADGQTDTSAIAQPVQSLLKHLIAQEFAGIILDNSSAPRRAVVPTEVLERALLQADSEMRVKALVAGERDADTGRKVAQALTEAPFWVAVGKAAQDKVGIAEARLADGTRLLQIYSHPLEVAAQGREERAMPMKAAQLGKALRDQEQLAGVLVDPAGPLLRLDREELAPVIALADA